jgi:hypothetical protein
MSRLKIVLILGLMTSVAFAQRNEPDHSVEIYALAAVAGSPETTPAPGFGIGAAWRLSPEVRLVADFGKHFGSANQLAFNSVMVGPRFYSEEQYRLSGFVQVLTGGAQSRVRHADWGFVLAPGAGVDIRLTDKLTLRPLQVDWILGPLRVSSGFAFRFGH